MPMVQIAKVNKLMHYEMQARKKGYRFVAGIDEDGRGPLAGPVVVAGGILPPGMFLEGINDSKKLTSRQRDYFYETIVNSPGVHYGIGIVDHKTIDEVNILQATIRAMAMAVKKISHIADYLLVDGLKLVYPSIPGEKIIKGDTVSQSIMAAAILAKVTRDRFMRKYDELWPEYGFKDHKGYGTKIHREAIMKYGPCHIHRMSFEPIKSFTSSNIYAE